MINSLYNLKKKGCGYRGAGYERCKKCIHWSTHELWCNYILDKGKSRGCPPNDECTVFEAKKKRRLARNFNNNHSKWGLVDDEP